MKQVKTIGVLTSGGDAPGMNAAIRAVVRAGIGKGMRVLGIRRGYNGLINGDMVEMNLRSVSDILQKGGTILYTARCLEFKEESGIERAKQTCVETGLDGVVVIRRRRFFPARQRLVLARDSLCGHFPAPSTMIFLPLTIPLVMIRR